MCVERLISRAPRHLRPCILFEDEARFGRISTVRACWAPPGMRPITAHQRVREYRDGLLAVAPWEGRIAARVDSLRVDHEAMSTFLTEITVRFPRRYWIVFLDGDGAHVSHDLGVPRNMHLELLPPYIPELNPVEPIWDYVREHYFANRAFATVDRVASQLCKAFRDLDATPERVRSISLFDWVKAAN